MTPTLARLLASNRGRGLFKAEASGDEATVWLYDYITSDDYYGGVSAINFAKELASIKAATIHLRINSPGGDVFAGRAMEQAIREHKSRVVTHVDGYAASAASYVALAADEVLIAPGAMFMIHKAWTLAMGNSDDLKQTASLLDQIDEALVKSYADATGQDPEQLAKWMTEETWFTAEQSVEYGFADAIASGSDKASARAKAWDLSAYRNAPAARTELPEPEDDPTPRPDFAAMQRRLQVASLI